MIVADTGAVLALLDAGDRHHKQLLAIFEADPDAWVLPWAILPEVDYLVLTHLGQKVELALIEDLAAGRWRVEWGDDDDVKRAHEIALRHRALDLGLVDAVVMAVAERLEVDAIATLDLRDFGEVKLKGNPRLIPRDRQV